MIRCPAHTIANGVVLGNELYFGHEVAYQCNDGFILHDGDSVRSCGKSGIWEGKMPRCAGKLYPSKSQN